MDVDRPRQSIQCEGFILRCWQGQSDFSAAFRLINESLDHLLPWEEWVVHHTEENTRAFLAKSVGRWTAGDLYNYAIDQNGNLIGMCQAYRSAESDTWRLGYWLHPAATGQGIATRAVSALVTEMFTLPEVKYIEVAHDLANTASGAIPQRLGFVEMRRERATQPATPSGSGVEVIWRMGRPD